VNLRKRVPRSMVVTEIRIAEMRDWIRFKSAKIVTETCTTEQNVVQQLSQSSEDIATVFIGSACYSAVVSYGLREMTTLPSVVVCRGGGWASHIRCGISLMRRSTLHIMWTLRILVRGRRNIHTQSMKFPYTLTRLKREVQYFAAGLFGPFSVISER
jgi:hypothetical protein